MSRMRIRGGIVVAAVLAAVAIAGCGAEDFSNKPRPPAPISIAVHVDESKVSVAPNGEARQDVAGPFKVGAGLAIITATNQTGSPTKITVEGPETDGQTQKMDPNGGTGRMQIDLRPGRYKVQSDDRSVADASIQVGGQRPSSRDQLLLP